MTDFSAAGGADSFAGRDNKDDSKEWLKLRDRLRTVRKERVMTQEGVAAHLGIQRTALCDIENGNRSLSAIELSQLAKLYDVSVDSLLGEDNFLASIPTDVLELARIAARLKQRQMYALRLFAEFLLVTPPRLAEAKSLKVEPVGPLPASSGDNEPGAKQQ